jgi:hypothetical protein
MGFVTALDFTEQLMIFEKCGMIYDNADFVQASQVRDSHVLLHESRAVTDLILASRARAHHVGEVRGVERSFVVDEGGRIEAAMEVSSHPVMSCGSSDAHMVVVKQY